MPDDFVGLRCSPETTNWQPPLDFVAWGVYPKGTPSNEVGSDPKNEVDGRAPRQRGRATTEHPAEHLASKSPRGLRARRCRSCGAPILRGLDEDITALVATVDPAPLSAVGEAIARLQGRHTYELRRLNRVPQLMLRNYLTIASRPPGSKTWAGPIDVVAEHGCHAFPLPTIPTVHPPSTPTRKARTNDQPPY